jgi:FkbM family methyltransferase
LNSLPSLHSGARVVEHDPLTIETTVKQWSYAASFNLPTLDFAKGVEVLVDVEVRHGELGVGLLTVDESAFHMERMVAAEDGRISLSLALIPHQSSKRLIMRNVSGAGLSALFTVYDVRVREVQRSDGHAVMPVIDISSALLKRFNCFRGPVPAGFWVNWLGVVTRSDVWPFPPDVQAAHACTRFEVCEFPLGDEHVLDWVSLLDAVVSARDAFRMIALGAGWGRWLSAGAFAARQMGLPFHLTGVEAEPDHFVWMQLHMVDNNIPESGYRLIHGAASGASGFCWFPVAQPHWYGQSIVVPDATVTAENDIHADGKQLRRVQAVTIEELLSPTAPVDCVHMDIQGGEYQFLSRNPELLDASVRLINIGTHSEVIERRLRRLFTNLKWDCCHDIQLGTFADVRLDGAHAHFVQFGDGVQVWRNPRLGTLSWNARCR